LTEQIKLDRYLQPHFRYYMREVRIVVYSQFLESYKSVTMEAMAAAFGVTVDFIDQYVLYQLLWLYLCNSC
jgi:26S proteasome regulatory subunit N7